MSGTQTKIESFSNSDIDPAQSSFPKVESDSALLGSRYQVISQLRQGGFGYTFLAEDTHRPGSPLCVVKRLARWFSIENAEQAHQLFAAEAQTLEKLGEHPQIPRLLAYFEQGGEFYLVQELINGQLLTEELIECWPYWQDEKIIEFLNEMLSLLGFVHQHDVIHRDIKPDNLIRRQEDGKLVLIDFGVAKQGQLDNCVPGKSVNIVGTSGYAPPEQQQGCPRFNSDLYTLGMVAIEAATGCHPDRLPRTSSGELKWRSFATKLSPWLADVLDGMIRQNAQNRYQRAQDILQDILKNLNQMPDRDQHLLLLECISKYDCLVM
ncbi:serine/threonine-protein kinase [Acaryochloris thomasi]|nr:serine/threonine-protein kinase [Acaryochloris thomasi]